MAMGDKGATLDGLKVSHDNLDGKITDLKSDLTNTINVAGTNLFSISDKSSDFTSGAFISTPDVGGTLDPTAITSDSNMAYVLFPVSSGDSVLIKGMSKTGRQRRYFVLTNSDYIALQTGLAGGADRDTTVQVAQDGYIVVNLRNDYDITVMHQTATINKRVTDLEESSSFISIGYNSFTQTPRLFRFSRSFNQGEFGGFTNVLYARKTDGIFTFEFDTMIFVPNGFRIVVRYNNTATRTAYDNYCYIPKNTPVSIAIAYLDETLEMTEEVARENLYYTQPITLDPYIGTFCSPGIFGEFAVIGDSYSLGSMHWENNGYKGYTQYSWAKLMCKRHGNNCTLYSHGGYGISKFIELILPTVLTDDAKDFYWWGLGINDAGRARLGTDLGSIEDLSGVDWTEYPDTLYGMYAKAYEQVAAHAPLAKHVFVSCIKETPNHRWTSYKAINTLLEELADYYGVPFIDLVDDPFYTSKFYADEIMTGHPTLIGYGGMSYANERLLSRCIASNVAYFKDYGRTNNPSDTDPTGTE